ncbi:hypothetical protein GCM10010389_37160 [Streptomyces echinoruber]|uniref:Fibrillarin n=1 Tax=Streptomyces echinoruber TaxID=68898 RepID=A0A918REC5_9ACTN|nr:hypothetical protein GCM10010389_37160 [Streptomyces echinoruber]
MARTVLGGAAGLVWLMLPVMTISTGSAVAAPDHGPAAPAAAHPGPTAPTAAHPRPAAVREAGAADYAVPLAVAAAAGAAAALGHRRRTRRARTRTTPGGPPATPAGEPLADLDERAGRALVSADDCLRTSREELGFAEALVPADALAPAERAVRRAADELAAAFALRQRYDDDGARDEETRRHLLVGIIGRCAEAGRRLDAEAAGFDRLRALETDPYRALAVAEARFRELTGRVGAADATLVELDKRYAPSAVTGVLGCTEEAKDRLVFATAHLNQARRSADLGRPDAAARELRAAEGAVAQAGVLVAAVDRLAAELSTAADLVPDALAAADAALADVRKRRAEPDPGAATAGLGARLARAEAALSAVRDDLGAGPCDPLDVLTRIVRAVAPLAPGRSGVLPSAARLAALSATAAAADFVTTHRGAVGFQARTRLAEAERLLAADAADCADLLMAGQLALQARELAERDVRAWRVADPDARVSGFEGAVLGGVLLGGAPGGGPPGSFGGPGTRGRRRDA